MANLNKTQLDASQCIVGAYDGVEEASRVIIASATEFAIELNATDGDSVLTYPAVSNSSLSPAQTPATANGTVLLTIPGTDKYSKFQVYIEALAGVSAVGKCYIQGSPDTTGSVWANLGSEISSSASVGVVASAVTEFIAKRLRIVSSAAPTGGNVEYTIILKS
jgi:hypothetical protein